MTMLKWIELIRVLGPKLKEALPVIMELIKAIRDAWGVTSSPQYALGNAPSPEFTTAVNEAVAAGLTEDEALEIANLLS